MDFPSDRRIVRYSPNSLAKAIAPRGKIFWRRIHSPGSIKKAVTHGYSSIHPLNCVRASSGFSISPGKKISDKNLDHFALIFFTIGT